jgi:hypothetical protein
MDSGQLAAIIAAIGAGLGGIAVAVRWVGGRIAKSFDDMAAALIRMAEKHEAEERELVRLAGVVTEARADAAEALDAVREARDVVIERVGRRTGPKPAVG